MLKMTLCIEKIHEKIYMIHNVLTSQIFSTPKKLCFWQNCGEVLSWLNSANWAELYKSHMQELRDKVMYKGHVQGFYEGFTYKGHM